MKVVAITASLALLLPAAASADIDAGVDADGGADAAVAADAGAVPEG